MKSVIQSKCSNLLLTGALLLTMGSCGNKAAETGMMPTGPQQLPVLTIRSGAATDTLQFTSTIQGVNNVNIQPQISGYLTAIYVDEGQYVHKGEVLFRIDSRPYQEQLSNALGQLKSAEANVLSAKLNVDKQAPLVEKKVVAPINLKQARANYEAVNASVAQARAAVQTARINLGYCTIKAPVDGYVGSLPFKVGSLVGPGGGQPLTVVSQINQVYAYFSMSEDAYMKFQETYAGGSIQEKISHAPQVLLKLADGSVYGQKGKIQVVEGQFDQNTASIQFRAIFNNPGNILRTGNTGTVLLPQDKGEATLVPIASTTDLQDKVYVWKVDSKNTVHQAILNISGKSGDYYVVAAGIADGDRIVASGFDRLTENTPIKPVANN